MSNPIISVKNVTFKYDSEDFFDGAAIKNLSLEIERGSFTVILGHNGSGKSTLARLLNGLIKPNEGEVLVDGISTRNEKKEFEIRKNLGLVFQNPDNQIVCTVVEEDVAFGPENLGVPAEEIRKRVDKALETVGMSEYKNHFPYQLSGGQKQRVALAGVLAMEPSIIVLDEPTAMLDPIGRKEVISTIEKLNKEKNITIILITHFMEEAENADRIIVMNNGTIVADGTVQQVFKNSEVIKKSGLALPQTSEILEGINNKFGLNLNTAIISPKDAAKEIYCAIVGGDK